MKNLRRLYHRLTCRLIGHQPDVTHVIADSAGPVYFPACPRCGRRGPR